MSNDDRAVELKDHRHLQLLYRYRIPLPPPEAPLSTLRALIEERTGVAPEYQKLIMNGGVMQKGEWSVVS